MSNTFKDLLDATLAALENMEDTIDSPEIETICINLQNEKNEEVLDAAIEGLLDVLDDELQDLTSRRYEREVTKWGQIIAECCVFEVAIAEKLKREFTNKEHDAFEESQTIYHEKAGSRNRRSDRSRNRDRDGGNRRNRGERKRSDRNERSSRQRNRRGEDNDRGNIRNGSSQRDEIRSERASESPRARQEETTVEEVDLVENQIINQDSYNLLPKHLRDVPVYYASLEKLVYANETVAVALLGDNSNVDYNKHRTDLYLSPNRQPENIAKTIEMLEEDALAASQKVVKAFVEKPVDDKDPAKEGLMYNDFAKIKDANVTLQGVYEMELPVFGAESMIRDVVAENMGKENIFAGVVSVAIKQVIGFVSSNFTDGKDKGDAEVFAKLKTLANGLVVGATFTQIREFLEVAKDVLRPDGFDALHRIINQAVCDAVTVSSKVSVKTSTLLNDFDGILNFIDGLEKEDPNIGTAIMTNIGWALPKFIITDDSVSVIRNYIFLPFSKNELTFASTTRYGTIDPGNKKELFEAVDKIFEVNFEEIGYTAFTTLVTSDNGAIYVLPNKSLTKHKGYYLTKEI